MKINYLPPEKYARVQELIRSRIELMNSYHNFREQHYHSMTLEERAEQSEAYRKAQDAIDRLIAIVEGEL